MYHSNFRGPAAPLLKVYFLELRGPATPLLKGCDILLKRAAAPFSKVIYFKAAATGFISPRVWLARQFLLNQCNP